jgi:hypothetical protein
MYNHCVIIVKAYNKAVFNSLILFMTYTLKTKTDTVSQCQSTGNLNGITDGRAFVEAR